MSKSSYVHILMQGVYIQNRYETECPTKKLFFSIVCLFKRSVLFFYHEKLSPNFSWEPGYGVI